MADYSIYKVDLDTAQPGGRKGESPRAAFTKVNSLIDELENVDNSLGTAATKDVTTSPTDSTPNRVLKVGDFGVGKAIRLYSNNDLNTLLKLGDYVWNSVDTPINAPFPNRAGRLIVKPLAVDDARYISQEYYAHNSSSVKLSRNTSSSGSTWSGWAQEVNTENLALIHSTGSNADGDWIKLMDDTLICLIRDSSKAATTSETQGNLYQVPGGISYTFPAEFASAPTVLATGRHGGGGVVFPGRVKDITTTGCVAWLLGVSSSSNGYLHLLVIGKAK